MSLTYSIRAVAERTGLSTHTIRAWEKRYSVLSPDRTDTNRRLYLDADIARLVLLRRAVLAGNSIGMISDLSDEELLHLAAPVKFEGPIRVSSDDYLAECNKAMFELDGEEFERTLVRASTVLGVDGMLTDVVVPMLADLDQGWESGNVGIAHEHLATALLRTQLERIRQSFHAPHGAPRLLVTTPQGQVHELGALLVAVAASREGWHVTYLGPNLPAEEIALAAGRIGVHAIALSVVYPAADIALPDELRSLRKELGQRTPILVGGRAAGSYSEVLREISAMAAEDFGSIIEALSNLKIACSPGGR